MSKLFPTDHELTHIFREIYNGRNNHGSFLRTFSEAYLLADEHNQIRLRHAAIAIVDNYDLARYLDTYKDKEQP